MSFRKVGKFLADYVASRCRTNTSNFKILLLGLVTLIHNPTAVDSTPEIMAYKYACYIERSCCQVSKSIAGGTNDWVFGRNTEAKQH